MSESLLEGESNCRKKYSPVEHAGWKSPCYHEYSGLTMDIGKS